MNASDYSRIAKIRLDEANSLYQRRKYSGAYYLSGYAIECSLKAAIARLTRKNSYPLREGRDYYIHNLNKLMDLAQLTAIFDVDVLSNPTLGAYWNVVNVWSEESRYKSWDSRKAHDIVLAVSDDINGIYKWITSH